MIFISSETEKDKQLSEKIQALYKQKKTVFTVFLEKTELSPGLSLLLGTTHGILKYTLTDDEFTDKLCGSPVLRDLSVTREQKRFSKFAVSGIIAAALIFAAAAFFIFSAVSGFSAIPPDSPAGKLGLKGNPMDITEVFVYGEELRGNYQITSRTDGDKPKVLFISSGETAEYGELSDVSDFSRMKNLERLCLTGNNISDISPLYRLEKLTLLDVSKNGGLDISGITALSGLETLSIAFDEITGYDALTRLPKLKTLYASVSQREALEALGEPPFEIIYLDLADVGVGANEELNGEEEPQIFGENESVTELYIYGDTRQNGFRLTSRLREPVDGCNIGFLQSDDCFSAAENSSLAAQTAAHTELERLSLCGTGLKDISPLSALKNLKLLDISLNGGIADLSALSSLESLEILDIAFIEGDEHSFAPIKQLKNLKTLYLDLPQYYRSKDFFGSLSCGIVTVDVQVSDYSELKKELSGNERYRVFAVGEITVPEGETPVLNGRASMFLWGEWADAALINNGTVEIYGERLWSQSASITNNGTVVLKSDSAPLFGRSAIESGGTVIVEGNAELDIMKGTVFEITNGTFEQSGVMELGDGGQFIWSGGNIVNNGTMNIDPDSAAFDLGGEKSGCTFTNNGTINYGSN